MAEEQQENAAATDSSIDEDKEMETSPTTTQDPLEKIVEFGSNIDDDDHNKESRKNRAGSGQRRG